MIALVIGFIRSSKKSYGRADDAISLDTDRTYTSADGVGGIDFNSNGFTLQDNHRQEMLHLVRMFIGDSKDNATYNFWKDYSANSNNFEVINTPI